MASCFKASIISRGLYLKAAPASCRKIASRSRVIVAAAMGGKNAWICPSDASHHLHTLGLNPGALQQDIKKAYRRLALQYHPDVCKGKHCSTNFTQINQAYEIVMNINGIHSLEDFESFSSSDGLMGVSDESWEDWEEWMGWEGAGTLDYSSHINYAC